MHSRFWFAVILSKIYFRYAYCTALVLPQPIDSLVVCNAYHLESTVFESCLFTSDSSLGFDRNN